MLAAFRRHTFAPALRENHSQLASKARSGKRKAAAPVIPNCLNSKYLRDVVAAVCKRPMPCAWQEKEIHGIAAELKRVAVDHIDSRAHSKL